MFSNSENPYSRIFVNQVSDLFPSIKSDQSFQKFQNYDFDQLSQNIPSITKKLPYDPKQHRDYLENIRKCRSLQEQTVFENIQKAKNVDFMEEVTKLYPEVGKAFEESENSQIALERIYKESQDRLENFKRDLRDRCDAIFAENRRQENSVSNQDNWAYYSERCESESDPLGFLDLKTVKRAHSDLPLDFEHDFRKEDDQNIGSPNNHKPKKIVFYSTSKRYVFGFDKVENLMEPSMMEEEILVDNGRDILREINNLHYDHNPNTNFKFLNFS